MRGRPPKPVANTIEPKPPDGIPMMPDFLDGVAAARWVELVEVLGKTGVLTMADADVMASYCICYARWRAAEAQIVKNGVVIERQQRPRSKPASSGRCIRFGRNATIVSSARA